MPYPGGKSGAGTYQRIINQIPPHDVYIEPFAGDAAIYRAKGPAARSILVEVDRENATRLADELGSGFLGLEVFNCCGIDWLRHEFALFRIPPPNVASPAADVGSRGPAGACDPATVHRRGIRRRQLCDDPATSTTARSCGGGSGGGSRSFIYADPPYLLSTRRSKGRLYRHEMSDAQHAELLDVLLRLPAMVAISGYASSLYASMLKGWRHIEFTCSTRGRPAREHLWMNYPEPTELHDYRYLGGEKRERERITRKVRTWAAGLQRLPRLERQAILAAIVGPADAERSCDGS